MKVKIIYWSGTGNTEKMANAINDAMLLKYDTEMKFVKDAKKDDVVDSDIILLGCPAMGAEELEADEFQPFYDSVKELLKNKKVGLFGSYAWAEGEWMGNWIADANACGIDIVDSIIVHEDNINSLDVSSFVEKF